MASTTNTVPRPTSERLPIDPYPSGWFQVAFSEDIATGAVLPLHYFGKELVAYRGDDGVAHVVEAYCPHLGAHLGYGGRVEQNDLVCPFHEWRFDGEGRNVEIPYAEKPNRAACLTTLPVREIDGLVMVWYHRDGAAPSWDFDPIWELSSGDFAEPAKSIFEVRSHPQDIYENAVDMAHFVSVHRADRPTPESTLEIKGPRLVATTAGAQLKTTKGYFQGQVQSELWGLGLDIARISGIIDTVIVMTTTPIDGEVVHCRFAVTARQSGGSTERTPEEVNKLVKKAQDRLIREFLQDVAIWENKRFNAVPRLAPNEKPVTQYRRWASQFYPGAEQEQ